MTIKGTILGRRLIAAAFVGSIAVLGGCGAAGDEPEGAAASSSAPAPDESAAAQPEPDLEGLPDVVAVVNGTEIKKDEFTTAYEGQFPQAAAQAQAGGQEVDQDLLKTTVADNLVSTELLRQEADERGIEATPEARAAAIENLLETSQLGSEEELRAAFAEQGLDDAEFDSQLSDQVKLDALLEEEAGDTTPTDEEIQEAYDAATAQQEAGGATASPLPPLDEVRDEIEEQLKGGKTSAAAEALIAQLREGADITVNL
ncbi:SurA N-terminal domain-containing protein [Arthrobacter antioxidans]|uniref:SurA N-terminal domain-containing protein n=1 Tax=Arthrobacter antioxidans TaxID=2895818 RepID=UPI001FFF4C81|nr:SurA N-terminal domain-containing protein [Arthrobacter antioxidans]